MAEEVQLEEEKEVQLVAFRVGGEEYGIDIQQVEGINKMQEITDIPNAPEFVEGVINLRGRITPVMDMRKRLGAAQGGEDKRGKETRIVIIEREDTNVGIIVDSVTGVTKLSHEDISPPPAGNENEFIKGVGQLEDRLIILLDIDKIMPEKI